MTTPTSRSRRLLAHSAGWVRSHALFTLASSVVIGVALGQLWIRLDEPGGERSILATVQSDAGSSSTRLAVEFPPQERGRPVELDGTGLDGRRVAPELGRGRAAVVNVWGSWCPPCREEAPVLAAAARRYAGRVDFVGVNVRDNPAAARAFEERFEIPYPSISDTDGRAVLALNQHVPANAVPATLVLDRRGRVAARVLGALREATLRALLGSVLSEPDPARGEANRAD